MIVMKFGGAAMANIAQIQQVAEIISNRKKKWDKIAVVVSAMQGTTDQLIQLGHQINSNPPQRELDMLISAGERITISLLAMALEKIQIPAVSFTGSQSGILTDERHNNARITDVRPYRLEQHLERSDVVIVAGFQGVCARNKEITTLGRGGSDTSAVALGIALGAEHVEFFKDVDGIYDRDPKLDPKAIKFDYLSYDEVITLTLSGAKILHSRAVELAQKSGIPLEIYNFRHDQVCGTRIGSEASKRVKVFEVASSMPITARNWI